MFPGKTVILEPSAHVGHGAVIHGAHLGENCLIGMNAVIMDDVKIGKESIVGALSFVAAGLDIPERSLVVGNPGKVIKTVSDEMIAWKSKGTALYQSLPEECSQSLKDTSALTKEEENRPDQENLYDTWNAIKGEN